MSFLNRNTWPSRYGHCISSGLSRCALARHAWAWSKNSAAMNSFPISPKAFASSAGGASARPRAACSEPKRVRMRSWIGTAALDRSGSDTACRVGRAPAVALAIGSAANRRAGERGHQHDADRAWRHHRPLPSTSVVYRSTGTCVHASVLPAGHVTRTVRTSAESANPTSDPADRWRRHSCRRHGLAATMMAAPGRSTSARAPNMSRPVGAGQPQADPMTALRPIDEEPRGPVVVAHQHVHVAVVVDVAKGCAAANLRPRSARRPARAVTSSKRPAPRFCRSSLRWWRGSGSPACRRLSMTCTAPFTDSRSSRPSLSKSSHAVPNPVNPRLAGPNPRMDPPEQVEEREHHGRTEGRPAPSARQVVLKYRADRVSSTATTRERRPHDGGRQQAGAQVDDAERDPDRH